MKGTFYLIATVTVLSLTTAASAQHMDTLFRGTVISVDVTNSSAGQDPPIDIWDTIRAGYTYEGYYTTDLSTPDSSPNPEFGRYSRAITAFELRFLNPAGEHTYMMQMEAGSIALYTVESDCHISLSWGESGPPRLAGIPLWSLELLFYRAPPLASDSLPSLQMIASDYADTRGSTLFGEPIEGAINILGQIHSLLAPPVQVQQGFDQSASLRNGASHRGGTDVMFDNVTADGMANVDYAAIQSWDNPERFGIAGFDYTPVGSRPQIWDVEFDGTFDGEVTLTFCYDELLLEGISEEDLRIAHYADGQWELLTNLALDPAANTITVSADTLSPFLLTVPEPTTFGLLLLSATGLLRRRRRAGNPGQH